MAFCTLFDSNYSYKGWVLLYTLLKQNPSIKMYVLCIDDKVFNEGKALNIDNLILIKLKDLENSFINIKNLRTGKKLNEYIVSLKPFLPSYIFNKFEENQLIFVDADIAFFNNPNIILDSMKDYSLYLYDLDLDKPRSSGPITSGFMGFKNDENTHKFLKWWQDRCVEWCFWRAGSNKKFAEQGYLNVFYDEPKKFKNFFVCKDPGIHIGSWNIARHKIHKENEEFFIDQNFKLVCYHFHEFKLQENSYFPTGWPLNKEHIEWIYDPYFKLIKKYQEGDLWKKI